MELTFENIISEKRSL